MRTESITPELSPEGLICKGGSMILLHRHVCMCLGQRLKLLYDYYGAVHLDTTTFVQQIL